MSITNDTFDKEIVSITNNLLKLKEPIPDGFIDEFHQISKEDFMPTFYNLFQIIEAE